jgi:hypothetical protein
VATTVIARFAGDPQDLVARYDQQCAALLASYGGADKMEGLIAHTASITAEGIVIVDAWESAEAFQRMAGSKAFQDSLVASGLPEPAIELCDLHNVVRPEVPAGAAAS